ncbi:glutathione S-transferase N-terminal domain-containing protein [Teredinibacter sp. KSP-S5-2]|uniref:glutathione S-transferase N-terminal domain-containing protein n=1 Tax=Teredinibacter sp. KSP-S5-2 TaxID=3034506 RepID=UPI002934DB8A|nr:glutathione S-transferase N-terminal domain-containing protein [Teredinibacter sp. KSP-S5-2]WNO08534.1 glutathione S-transferase N-terminal domain-containing protein [Teredinibacter sp. KSP-S5-2]
MGVVTKRSSMTYFSDPKDHYSHRVRIVLAEKGVTVDLVDADSANVPAEVSEINPYSTLPTLVDRELTLFETSVMMEYLDERFPHPPLLPVYPVARAESRQFICRIERDWCPLVRTITGGKNKEAVATAAKDLKDSLVSIAPIFAEKPFFMSDEFTLVDCCLAPILWRLEYYDIKLPRTRQVMPLLEYMDRMFNRESFKESLTELEREMRPGYFSK